MTTHETEKFKLHWPYLFIVLLLAVIVGLCYEITTFPHPKNNKAVPIEVLPTKSNEDKLIERINHIVDSLISNGKKSKDTITIHLGNSIKNIRHKQHPFQEYNTLHLDTIYTEVPIFFPDSIDIKF